MSFFQVLDIKEITEIIKGWPHMSHNLGGINNGRYDQH